MTDTPTIDDLLQLRFDDAPQNVPGKPKNGLWHTIANRQSCRLYEDKPVDTDLVRQLCALALASPTKSDLQQRDVIIIDDPDKRATINALFPGSAWIADAPVFLVFCGNNRRLRQIHDRAGITFENDHLDAFFNAGVDAGIALSAFALAAEAAGLGTCPISTIRDHLETVNELLELPDWVFPVARHDASAGRAGPIGSICACRWPPRFGTDTYNEAADRKRLSRPTICGVPNCGPYGLNATTTGGQTAGTRDPYTWSLRQTARQYAEPQRTDFGAYIRNKGFKLD